MKIEALLARASKIIQPGDMHFVVNSTKDKTRESCPGKLFNHKGILLYTWPVLTQGINGPSYKVVGGDTVEGTYALFSAIRTQPNEPANIKASFGRWFFGLGAAPGLADPQVAYGRAGEGIHGQYYELHRQPRLNFTHGCIRMFNDDLDKAAELWVPKLKVGLKILVTVDQED